MDGRPARSVLIIHSDADTRLALVSVLADRGYAARSSGIGELPAADGECLVITGLNGDGGDPRMALRWIDTLRDHYRAPILVVSAWPGAMDDPRFIESVAGHLRAPVDVAELLASVEALLASQTPGAA
jgi:DNA-binding response OmpR family regulator